MNASFTPDPTTAGLKVHDSESAFFGHAALITLLRDSSVNYIEIAHPAEGRTEAASLLRGHPLTEAAKCLVIEVRLPCKNKLFVNAVVPGDRRVDMAAVALAFGGRRAGMASPSRAEILTGCPMGAVLPFSFRSDLYLAADPALLDVARLVFNAGRLDLSVSISTSDYLAIARPRVVRLTLNEEQPS